jgi:hypothetical protein
VNNVQDIASSSVPDLRAARPLAKVLIALGGLVIAGIVVVAVMIFRDGDNPGRAACDHIEEMAKTEPKRWDKFVKSLERTVEERVWNSADRRYVNIVGATRYERCEESFGVIRDTISYSAYQKLATCVSKATTFRAGSDCFNDF